MLKIRTSNEEFYRLYRQALEDMAALRLPIAGTDHMVFLPAAGLPWFVAPFGRDSLIVSLQNTLIYPDFARGALDVLGSLQAKDEDDYRDAEPGKILHEMRYGELAHFKLIPHTPYYGTADATPLYLITLHAAWRATGDQALLERHLRDGRGLPVLDRPLRRPRRRRISGISDAFVRPAMRTWAGRIPATRGLSGRLAGEGTEGALRACRATSTTPGCAWPRSSTRSASPTARGNCAPRPPPCSSASTKPSGTRNWASMPMRSTATRSKVLTVASNAGHCLWSGIVPPERAEKVVERLMAPDMWSGWGIRTLSADHPAFNPYNYQTGSVWPHDNAIIALGFKRYGFGAEAARIARDISVAASHFLLNQLPELYTASERDETNFPVQYLGANVPQAWAAGSVFMLMQALLGFLPDAPRDKLYVDPALPPGCPT